MLKTEALKNGSDNNEPAAARLAYSVKETAVVMGVSYITVFRLIQRKKLRTVKALRTHLIPVDEVKRFLKAELS